MDAKITLSFNGEVIEKAKKFASDQNISLSRLTEYLYQKIVSGDYKSLDELPVSEWVSMLAEGEASYGKSKSRKELKSSYFDAKK